MTDKQTDIALVIRVTFVDEKIEKPKVSPLEILLCSHTHTTPAQVKINKYFTDMIFRFIFASLSSLLFSGSEKEIDGGGLCI